MKALTFMFFALVLLVFSQTGMANCAYHNDAKVTLNTPTDTEKQTDIATPLPTDEKGKLIVDTKKPEAEKVAN